MNSKLRDSVTVLFYSQGKYLILERAYHLKAFPGFTSFVGGKVDKEDHVPAVIQNNTALDDCFINALVREVYEEVGYDLKSNQRNILSIEYLGTATTPEFQKVRFSNRYFLIHLNSPFHPVNDEGEIRHSQWMSLDEFFHQDHNGEHMMVPPSREVLKRLYENRIDADADLDLKVSDNKVPAIEFIHEFLQIMPLSNTFPPANRTNCFYFGNPRLLVDPSPKCPEELKKLLNTIEVFHQQSKIEKIFLTHHHPDHYEYVCDVAKHFNVPILLSQQCQELIELSQGKDFFDGLALDHVREGDVICRWLGHKVIATFVPGHASSQVALVTETPFLAIVSDLIQTVGTVVVAPPNGNMMEYFNSLNRMIARNDRFIFPSHGLPLGGVDRLQKTLEHRKFREKDIKELLGKGMSVDEIVSCIYPDLDEKLIPYAKGTVLAHLEKIEKEATFL